MMNKNSNMMGCQFYRTIKRKNNRRLHQKKKAVSSLIHVENALSSGTTSNLSKPTNLHRTNTAAQGEHDDGSIVQQDLRIQKRWRLTVTASNKVSGAIVGKDRDHAKFSSSLKPPTLELGLVTDQPTNSYP
jgi:hypothetical protein